MADSIVLECLVQRMDLVGAIEDYFYELQDCPWVLELDAQGGSPTLRAYFADETSADEAFAKLQAHLGAAPGPFGLRTLPSRDWEHSYREHFHPWTSRGLHCVPDWQRASYAVPVGELVVYVDPGLAFGTGMHATTRLCAERMLDFRDQRRADIARSSVLDVGCGSGLLSIIAARLGFGAVTGLDIDPEAVAISLRNARLNGLDTRVELFTADLAAGLPTTADLVLANIHRNAVCDAACNLLRATRPNGTLVVSGFLEPDLEDVMEALRRAGESEGVALEARVRDEWAEVTLRRNAD